jgi:acetyl esterase/lipase
MVVKSYQFLSQQYPHDNFILMGDSAGGGLALVLAQSLRDQDVENRPQKLILYSPWVRLDMNNPEIQDFILKDSILDLDLLQKSARAYAGGDDLSDKYLSPYYGSCENLGEMHVFYGGDEMLAPDIKLLEKKCEAAVAEVYFYCYEGMGHDFQLFTFLPESQEVLRKTTEIINRI